jgi:hypothetical protein
MTMLTAYNKDAQNFILKHGKPHTHKKKRIMESIEQSVISSGVSFEKLFPPKSKRLAVLDEIIYYLSGSGICKVSATTLAENVGASVRTVFDAVKNIKKTDAFIVAGMADGKNKYIFVLKSHPNFKSIMKDVFYMDDAEQIAGHIAGQENDELVEAVSVEGNKTGSNCFISSITKQEKDIIRDSIENDVGNSGTKNQNSLAEQREKIAEYGANENQLWFFDMVSGENLPDQVKSVVGVLALRLGTGANLQKAHKGYRLACKIAVNIRDGVRIESVPAVFSDGLKHPLNKYATQKVVPAPKSTTPKQAKINPIAEFKKYIENRD